MHLIRQYPTGSAVAIIFALALALRFGFWWEIHDTPLDQWHEWNQTDMATYLEQARRISQGDWLAAEPYHPYHNWQGVAPEEKWLEWYGPHAFHQAPAYSYLLAAMMLILEDPISKIKTLQIILGAGSCVLIFLIGRRAGGSVVGWVAGLASAVYAPVLYLEPQILREAAALFIVLGILWLLLRHLWQPPGWRARPLLEVGGLGLMLGTFAMFHEMATVLFLVVLISLTVHWGSGHLPKLAPVLALLIAAYVAGFAPLLARNLSVGASPFSVSCRTRINFAGSNHAHAANGGATFSNPTVEVVEILDASGGTFRGVLRGVWESYDGDVGRIFSNWLLRFAYIWQPWEVPDNTSIYFYDETTRLLRWLPRFGALFPLGFAGILLMLVLAAARRSSSQGRWNSSVTSWLSRLDFGSNAALLLYLAGVVASLSLVHTVARFRLFVAVVFLVYAGVLVALVVEVIRGRRWVWGVAIAGVIFGGMGLQQIAAGSETTQQIHRTPRLSDYSTALRIALSDDDVKFAIAIVENAEVSHPTTPGFHRGLGDYFGWAGDRSRAAAHYRRALMMTGNDPKMRESLRTRLQKLDRGG